MFEQRVQAGGLHPGKAFENGELTLTIPKAAEIRPKVIKVKSK